MLCQQEDEENQTPGGGNARRSSSSSSRAPTAEEIRAQIMAETGGLLSKVRLALRGSLGGASTSAGASAGASTSTVASLVQEENPGLVEQSSWGDVVRRSAPVGGANGGGGGGDVSEMRLSSSSPAGLWALGGMRRGSESCPEGGGSYQHSEGEPHSSSEGGEDHDAETYLREAGLDHLNELPQRTFSTNNLSDTGLDTGVWDGGHFYGPGGGGVDPKSWGSSDHQPRTTSEETNSPFADADEGSVFVHEVDQLPPGTTGGPFDEGPPDAAFPRRSHSTTLGRALTQLWNGTVRRAKTAIGLRSTTSPGEREGRPSSPDEDADSPSIQRKRSFAHEAFDTDPADDDLPPHMSKQRSRFPGKNRFFKRRSSSGSKEATQEAKKLPKKTVHPLELPPDSIIVLNGKKFEDCYDTTFDGGEFLGEGASGRVLKAVHKTTKQQRAVKVIPKGRGVQRMQNAEFFYNELACLRILDHPHVVKLVGCSFSRLRETGFWGATWDVVWGRGFRSK